MANHNLPTIASTYVNVLAEIDGRLDDIAMAFNTEHTASTNIPTNTIRWNATNKYWEKYNGTVWAIWTTSLNVNINGSVGATTAYSGAFTTLSTTGLAALAAGSTVGGSAIITAGSTNTFTNAQTFSNSTSPIVSSKIGPSTTNQHTIPLIASDTFALLSATQTLTNKTYSAGTLTGTFSGSATLSGEVTFSNSTAPIISTKIGPSALQQHTLPVVTSDTIVVAAASQTLTNKTLSTGTIYNGSAITMAYGGHGGTTASSARSNLGLAIGTDIPALTGTGASGTWPISIGGNALTVTSVTSQQIIDGLGYTPVSTGSTGFAPQSTTYTKTEVEAIKQALVDSLSLKAPSASPTLTGTITVSGATTFSSTVTGLTKAMVGLSVVDNTSDINKPVSTPQEAALQTIRDSIASAASTLPFTSITSKPTTLAGYGITDFSGGATAITKITNSTNTNSGTTGALVVTGGVGIGQSLYVAGTTILGSYINTRGLLETVALSGAATGTILFDSMTQAVMFYPSASTGNFSINIRGNSANTLNTTMAIGSSLTIALLVTNGATPYYLTSLQVDGTVVTTKWPNASRPISGNANAIDCYTFTVIKTANSTYTVIASRSPMI